MKIIQAEQRTPEWYSARLGRITGSNMKNVMAIGARGQYLQPRDNYKRQLVAERLTGEQADKDIFLTDAMKWGILNEGTARTIYKLRTGNKVEEVGFIQPDEGMLGVSPDGLVNDDGLIEIKCLVTQNHLYNIFRNAMNVFEDEEGNIKDLLPKDYRDQVQMQMWITGREWCDFVGYDSRLPVGLDMFIVRIARDENYIDMMKDESRIFLEEVDRDVNAFLQYLPVAQRACKQCGSVFIDKLSMCHENDCYSKDSKILKILEEPTIKLTKQIENMYMENGSEVLAV